MFDFLSQLLGDEGIRLCRPVPLDACRIVRPYLLEKSGISNGTVFLFAIPYYSPQTDSNLSAYAVPRDYHAFLSGLADKLLPLLRRKYPENRFALFGDHSPIDELHAGAISGLGILGRNRMLITEAYASFVFLAEVITDYKYDCQASEVRYCEDCGKCRDACTFLCRGDGECLSALSQKKGVLTEAELDTLYRGGSVWGCDRCQLACPHTKKAFRNGTVYTEIPYFLEQTIPHLTSDCVREMTDEEFRNRAFAWRGRDTILRNLAYFEERERKEKNGCYD